MLADCRYYNLVVCLSLSHHAYLATPSQAQVGISIASYRGFARVVDKFATPGDYIYILFHVANPLQGFIEILILEN